MRRKDGYRNEKELSEEEINNILKEYYDGELSITEIREKYLLTRRALPNIFKAKNINSHRKNRYTLNERYFQHIDSEEKAYWLGYLFADGFVGTTKTNNIVFSQKESDKEVVQQFAQDIDFTGKLRVAFPGKTAYDNAQNQIVINFSSSLMLQDLYNLNLFHNKLKNRNELPPIDHNLLRHFVRGLFDGDGCIMDNKSYYKDHEYHKYSCNIAGNISFLEKIKDILPVQCKFHDSHSPEIKYLTCANNNSIKVLHDYFYKDATRFLQRKRNIFEKAKRYDCKKLQLENGINSNEVSDINRANGRS